MSRDRGQWAELAVLGVVLAIAALASYIHLQAVWVHAGAPVPPLGPLLVDGLFAAAWLRMRRRRRDAEPVGLLAWLALALALVATVAGNLAAAVIAGHRDPLSLVVAAWPAVAFALVWELVTGHGSGREAPQERLETDDATTAPTVDQGAPDVQEMSLADPEGAPSEPWEAKRDRLLGAGASRQQLVDELDVTEWQARKLQESWRRRADAGEATG